VVEVIGDSPAEAAGLHSGDLVLSAGGRPVSSAESLQKLLFADAIGVPFPLAVLRSGSMVEIIAVPQELPDAG